MKPGAAARVMAGALGIALVMGIASSCSSSSTPTAGATTKPTPAGAPKSPSAVYACQIPGYAGVLFAFQLTGSPPNAVLLVQRAQPMCGGRDEVYYAPLNKLYPRALAASVRVRLLVKGPHGPVLQPATLNQLGQLLGQSTPTGRFAAFFSGVFGVNVNAHGLIDSLDELYRP